MYACGVVHLWTRFHTCLYLQQPREESKLIWSHSLECSKFSDSLGYIYLGEFSSRDYCYWRKMCCNNICFDLKKLNFQPEMWTWYDRQLTVSYFGNWSEAVGNVGLISVCNISSYDIGIVVFFRLTEKWPSRDVLQAPDHETQRILILILVTLFHLK